MTPQTNVDSQLRAAGNSLQKALYTKSETPNKLAKDDFLKLMMAQVTHQDPLNPMDSQGMMQQLTSMGSLEQLVNINDNINALNNTQADVVRATAFSFLDKDVTVRGGGVSVQQGKAADLQFKIPREAQAMKMFITNPQGEPVRTLELGQFGPGTHAVPWDATDKDGQTVPDGYYRYTATATGSDEEKVPVDLFVRGKVSGVRFDNGRPKLRVNNEDIDVKDIIQMSNQSERLFGDREPSALREELRARPPVTRRKP